MLPLQSLLSHCSASWDTYSHLSNLWLDLARPDSPLRIPFVSFYRFRFYYQWCDTREIQCWRMHRQASDCAAAIASVRYLLRCGCKMSSHRYNRRTGAQMVTELGRCTPLLLALVLLEDVEDVRTQGGSKLVASLWRFVEDCTSLQRKDLKMFPQRILKVSERKAIVTNFEGIPRK